MFPLLYYIVFATPPVCFICQIRQLLEIEEQCKWGLVTLCSLLLEIDERTNAESTPSSTSEGVKQECIDNYRSLSDIDPTHTAYYSIQINKLLSSSSS